MKKKGLYISLAALIAFAIWTVLVRFVDVQAIGPENSAVGFASLNGAFHALTGVHMALYDLTDLLSVIPLGIIACFGLLGLYQWIRRKKLFRVDSSILVLGGFYVVVMAFYAFFEVVEVNYRPILIEGVLETSYPSSTTMLAMCVLPTAIMQLRSRIQNRGLNTCVTLALAAFTAFMVIGRLISGVHWLSDIIGGALLSTGLVVLYSWTNSYIRHRTAQKV